MSAGIASNRGTHQLGEGFLSDRSVTEISILLFWHGNTHPSSSFEVLGSGVLVKRVPAADGQSAGVCGFSLASSDVISRLFPATVGVFFPAFPGPKVSQFTVPGKEFDLASFKPSRLGGLFDEAPATPIGVRPLKAQVCRM